MGYHVTPLNRPYDFRVLIEAFVYTRRSDFVHDDFPTYYASLLQALEGQFGIRLSSDGLSFDQQILWSLFENTTASLLRIAHPWDGYLEDGLLNVKLAACGEPGQAVYRASTVIQQANKASAAAHREMMYSLFVAIFGESWKVVTSEELMRAGFDDGREPDSIDYYDYM